MSTLGSRRIMFGLLVAAMVVSLVGDFVEWRHIGVIHWRLIATKVCPIVGAIVWAVGGFQRHLRTVDTVLLFTVVLLFVWPVISAPPGHFIS